MFDLIKLKKDFRKIQKNKKGKRIVYPHVLKIRTLLALDSGYSQKELTEVLGVGNMTITKWRQKENKEVSIQVFPKLESNKEGSLNDIKITSPNGYVISGLNREDVFSFLNMSNH